MMCTVAGQPAELSAARPVAEGAWAEGEEAWAMSRPDR